MADELSQAQCTLLAVNFASESNIKSLHKLVASRTDELAPELILRILLTYLPESVQASYYTSFVDEVTSHVWLEQHENVVVDISSVKDVTNAKAQKRVKKLELLELRPTSFPPHAPQDLLTRFLCHRAQRIDSETGMLHLVVDLLTPFLDKAEYVRTFFISVLLPLIRLRYEYYPGNEIVLHLADFEDFDGGQGVDFLLAGATNMAEHEITSPTESQGTMARDLRGLVGPWMFGHTERKRRKLNRESSSRQKTIGEGRQISLAGTTDKDKTEHDWEHAYKWMVHKAVDRFPMVTNAVEEWDGPSDVDLGEYGRQRDYLEEELQSKLEKRYAQAAFASCYAVQANTSETIDGAHGILVRLAGLLDFEPPPDLATSVEQLPRIDRHASLLHESTSTVLLEPDALLEPNHPLTSPTKPTFMLLQMLVYSAYQLNGLGYPISIVNVTKLRFYSQEEEQMAMVQRVLSSLSANGKKDDHQWTIDRGRLLWLWNWNIDPEEGALRGAGPIGDITRDHLEKEILKTMIVTGNYSLVDRLYVQHAGDSSRLSLQDIEQVILGEAMRCYDNASNGNRTRGSMKKASDIITTFSPSFADSKSFQRASNLVAGTHALSFYSLTLQHGVPFQPANIRASNDPLSLLSKVLEQNPNSYTKLDDLISIGRNLSSANLLPSTTDEKAIEPSVAEQTNAAKTAEQRVIYMSIESALTNDDFDTAYSYLISRLVPAPDTIAPPTTTSSTSTPSPSEPVDDISWRAAFLAGRYRPRTPPPSLPSQIRRLEQRTELLSLSLLLAPPSALSDILNVYRRTEEETNALLAQQALSDLDLADRADKRLPGTTDPSRMPGVWNEPSTQGRVFGQERREMGRMYNLNSSNTTSTSDLSGGGASAAKGQKSNPARRRDGDGDSQAEAPVGLFDLAHGAARALGRNAFPLRGGGISNTTQQQPQTSSSRSSDEMQRSATWAADADERARVRKRDMVANAASGALASGLGWVLGATPPVRDDSD